MSRCGAVVGYRMLRQHRVGNTDRRSARMCARPFRHEVDTDSMNILDAIIIIVVAALVLIGFFSGVGRTVAALVSMYLGTVVAATFYDDVARRMRGGVEGMRISTSELASFLVLFVVFAVAFYWITTFSFNTVSAKRGRFVILDSVGGAALAMIVGILAIALTLSVTVILIGAVSHTSGVAIDGGEHGFLSRQIRGSELTPIVLELQPPISATFKPWFGGDLPAILQTPPS